MKQFHPKPEEGFLPRNQVLFELGCGHIFTVKYLDDYFKTTDSAVKPIGSRYGNAVKKAMADVSSVETRVMQNTCVLQHEREELSHAELWQGHIQNLSFWKEPVYGYKSYKYMLVLKKRLNRGNPVTARESCLIRFVNTFSTLNKNLGSYFIECDSIMNSIIKALLVPKMHVSPSYYLSWQLLQDIMSEMYRLALSPQCTIAKSHLPPINIEGGEMSRPEQVVTSVELFIQSLYPLKDRIMEKEYEQNFCQLSTAFPAAPDVHVETPRFPAVVKGTWLKCIAGHYYCLPPFHGSGPRADTSCPKCKEQGFYDL